WALEGPAPGRDRSPCRMRIRRAVGRRRPRPLVPCATGPPAPATGRPQPAFEDTHSMARGINKVILVGNLGNDPETKYTQGGTAITPVSVATTSSRKDKEGIFQEKTEWHRVKLFGKTAEVAAEYLKKGRQ